MASAVSPEHRFARHGIVRLDLARHHLPIVRRKKTPYGWNRACRLRNASRNQVDDLFFFLFETLLFFLSPAVHPFRSTSVRRSLSNLLSFWPAKVKKKKKSASEREREREREPFGVDQIGRTFGRDDQQLFRVNLFSLLLFLLLLLLLLLFVSFHLKTFFPFFVVSFQNGCRYRRPCSHAAPTELYIPYIHAHTHMSMFSTENRISPPTA